MHRNLEKILVANRGEIAVRIIRSLRNLGIRSVAVFAEDDRHALHVHMADEAFFLPGSTLSDTYLNAALLVATAIACGAKAVHPGYGFLSENAGFAEACEKAGLIFIGPSAEVMRLMGDKIRAREFARSLGIPVLNSLYGTPEELQQKSMGELRFPVLIKPSGGGGGKGMRVVESAPALGAAIEAASREAATYFSNPEVYLEEYIADPRHLEVQVLADGKGNAVHLFERECSIQRRFQKIIEEAPAPSLDEEKRKTITGYALHLATASKYLSAGTLEFLMDAGGNFYFLEMNTRLQVEHPVTEMITGIDLVEQQLHIASEGTLGLHQDDIRVNGHSMEARICAEDPTHDFLPSAGKVVLYREPEGEGLRIDGSFHSATSISPSYDPLISKLISWGSTREEARVRMVRALEQYLILGVAHNARFLGYIFEHPDFVRGACTTSFLKMLTAAFSEREHSNNLSVPRAVPALVWAYAQSQVPLTGLYPVKSTDTAWSKIGAWRILPSLHLKINDERFACLAFMNKGHYTLAQGSLGLSEANFSGTDSSVEILYNGVSYPCHFAFETVNRLHLICGNQLFVVGPDANLHAQDWGVEKIIGRNGSDWVTSPLHGKIVRILVKNGERVERGSVVMVLEAMKMENNIVSPADGMVEKLTAETGDQVEKDSPLFLVEEKAGD